MISLSNQKGETKILPSDILDKKPWKFDTISEKQFIEQADTGDILLFNCNHMGAKLTRTITNSQYDHIAMILKFDSMQDEVYIVEATGTFGVAMNKWSKIRKHVGRDKFYRKVTYRHLDAPRNQELCVKL